MARRKNRGSSSGREERRAGRRGQRAQAARSPPPSESDESAGECDGISAEEGSEEGQEHAAPSSEGAPSLLARVALLEVEVVALRAQNEALKQKLTEALSDTGRAAAAAPVTAKGGGAAARRRREPEAAQESGRRRGEEPHRSRREPELGRAEPEKQKRRKAQDDGSAPEPKAPRRQGSDQPAAEGTRGEPEAEAAEGRNAVMLVNSLSEVYNEAIPNNLPVEKRGPLLQDKAERFLDHFDAAVEIIDLKSGGKIIKDKKQFAMRYGCVFRESGAKLRVRTNKRFYFDARRGPTFSLDFETHESLVTATPGTRQDGSLGVRDPRTEHLAVLYEERNGKIARMWLAPDADKLGLDPMAGEDIMVVSPLFKQYEAKVNSLRPRAAGERIFHNYHNTPVVGA